MSWTSDFPNADRFYYESRAASSSSSSSSQGFFISPPEKKATFHGRSVRPVKDDAKRERLEEFLPPAKRQKVRETRAPQRAAQAPRRKRNRDGEFRHHPTPPPAPAAKPVARKASSSSAARPSSEIGYRPHCVLSHERRDSEDWLPLPPELQHVHRGSSVCHRHYHEDFPGPQFY